MSLLQSQLQQATAFMPLEILALGRERSESFEHANPALSRHHRHVELILRRAAHTLGPEGESVLAAAAPLQTQPATPPPHSMAVLPFVNMSADKEQEYFSDGLSEELVNVLALIDQLQVAARTSSFSFKGQALDVQTIARRLHVGAVLEGSVRRSGNTVGVTANCDRGRRSALVPGAGLSRTGHACGSIR
jgi:TolB-like protein